MLKNKMVGSLFTVSFFIALVAVLIGSSEVAYASGSGMPWETPLTTIKTSITGPVAMVVSILAIVAVGITLIFGGDMQGFIRQLLYVTLVVGLIVMANNVLTKLYSQASSALITISFIADKFHV